MHDDVAHELDTDDDIVSAAAYCKYREWRKSTISKTMIALRYSLACF